MPGVPNGLPSAVQSPPGGGAVRVSIIADDDTELSVEVDGVGRIHQIFRVREDGSERRTHRRRLSEDELAEVARLAGLDVEADDE